MKETILSFFTVIGVATIGMIVSTIIVVCISGMIDKRKKRKSSSKNIESDQTIKGLTIEATNDKQYVDEALSDCDALINFIKTCEKENKLSKEVEIIDEQIHNYRLLMSFNDPDSQIDFNKYAEKYNYNNSLVKVLSTKGLLMVQTFALRFFDYMFPNETDYSKGRNGICKMEFIHDENMNKYILNFEYVYGTKSVNHNYPILDGYYFGCMVGSQILVDELLNMVNDVESVMELDDLSAPIVKDHLKNVFTKMKYTLNSKKFPQFKD